MGTEDEGRHSSAAKTRTSQVRHRVRRSLGEGRNSKSDGWSHAISSVKTNENALEAGLPSTILAASLGSRNSLREANPESQYDDPPHLLKPPKLNKKDSNSVNSVYSVVQVIFNHGTHGVHRMVVKNSRTESVSRFVSRLRPPSFCGYRGRRTTLERSEDTRFASPPSCPPKPWRRRKLEERRLKSRDLSASNKRKML